MSFQEGRAVLQELHVSDSSEAILSGRKPPFRLLVRVIQPPGMRLKIRHAVSEGFVVSSMFTDLFLLIPHYKAPCCYAG